ncbi:MAG: hypothetical protein GY729_16305, partial [Desulfobacteraceae bacterium]|nr:hypothetical protein [Desulfobacteraceae bacterium]
MKKTSNNFTLNFPKTFVFYIFIILLFIINPIKVMAGYSLSQSSTTSGGGTWGSILRMTGSVSGSTATFTVSKQSGTFSKTSTVYIRYNSYNGTSVSSGTVYAGRSSKTLYVNLNNLSNYPYSFYGYVTNSDGHAYVGAMSVSKTNTAPSSPTISSSPSSGYVNQTTYVSVVVGNDSDGDRVKVQCTATGSSLGTYDSGWGSGGRTVNIPITFTSTGTKKIYCTTFDTNGTASSVTSRTISISQQVQNNAPSSPTISSSPSSGYVNQTTYVSVVVGSDSDGDQVKVQCTATGSSLGTYDSGWGSGGRTVNIPIIFTSTGTKTIYCTTFDTNGAASSVASRTISISQQQQNTAPSSPTISSSPSSGYVNQTTYVSVVVGSDSDGDQVKVQSTATDSSLGTYDSGWGSGGRTVNIPITFTSTGTKTIYCTTFDTNGTASSVASRTISISQQSDTSNPTGSISGVPSSTTIGNVFTITTQAEDTEALEKITLHITDGSGTLKVNQSWYSSNTSATYTYPVNTTDWQSGTCYVALWVLDAAGNTTEINDQFTLSASTDTTDPTGSISGVPSSTTVGNVFTITTQAEDTEALEKITLHITDGSGTLKVNQSWYSS